MTELVLTDITVMRQGYCVVGLQQLSDRSFHSVRPIPPGEFAWHEPFVYRRGDYVRFESVPAIVPSRPHVEDRQSLGLVNARRSLNEADLLDCLQEAEVASHPEDLFGFEVRPGTTTGLWVDPPQASRSICGCEYENIRFQIISSGSDLKVRSEIALRSGDRLTDIRIVDREWRRFVQKVVQRLQQLYRSQSFLNGVVRREILKAPRQFARIGLSRPFPDKSWLMLDSLFPQPNESWLDLL